MPWSGTAAALAEFRGLQRVYPVVKITFANGTVVRVAEESVASTSKGMFLSYLRGMSGFRREASDSDFSLRIPTPSITIYDQDRVLQKLLGGPLRGKVRGATVEVWWVSDFLEAADHYQDFAGVVKDYSLSGDREYSFEVSLASAEKLNGTPKIPLLGVDFPTAPPEVLNEPLWVVYGKHASLGLTGATGMVRALPVVVDANGDSIDWVLAYGQIQIQRLWRTISNVMTEDTANWAFYVLERGEHRYQMARYTGGGTKPKPDDTVAFDCWGLFATAPATASVPIENPASCIRNFLAHFVFGDGDVRAGTSWASETGKPIASAIFNRAATYFSDHGMVMAKVIRANEKVADVFNGWCDDFDAVPMFGDAWGIGAMPEDEGELGIYQSDRHLAEAFGHFLDPDGNPDPPSMATSRSTPVSELLVGFLYDDATGELTDSILVADPSQTVTVREDMDLEYGDGSLIDL